MFPSIVSAQTDSTTQSVLLSRGDQDTSERRDREDKQQEVTRIHPVRFGIVTGTVAAAIAGIHFYQANGWWKDNRAPFHFQEDLKYGLSVDKLGHFYGGAAAAFILRKSYQWAGLSEEGALYWGSAGSLLFQTYVEIEDGFSKWGFDRVDFAFDVAGAAWPIAQYHSPFLQNFDFKFSYHPSPALNSSAGAGFQGQQHIIFDDYEGQTLWLSMRMENLLPNSLSKLWPDFLSLSVGYAVRDVFTPKPYSAFLIALDLDMTKVIPNDTPFLKLLGEALNFIKFPMPAVQISPKIIWYGIYF
jgi:hypothetical protein